jgi:hypothetical protein
MANIHTTTQNNNIQIFEYFVVFLFVIYAGKASLFVLAIENWDNPIGLLLPIISVTILGFTRSVQFNYKFLLLIVGFTIYFVASTIRFGALHPRFYGINLINITITYVLISGLRFQFFKYYEDILYYLCIIALTFWLIQNIIPSVFIEFLRNFEFSTQGPIKGNVDFNVIVYTVSNFAKVPDSMINIGNIHLFRNAGFAWESGAFATYINMAIFINLIRRKFQLKNNKHLWVLVAALFTTFSTTGYSCLVLLAFFYLYNKDLLNIFVLAPIVTVLTAFFFTLPFMSEKIANNTEYNTDELIYMSATLNNTYAPQRFQSLQIDFVDFLNSPIIGYGGHLEARWTNQLGANIPTVSGIGNMMAQFGLVGLIFFLVSLWYSSKQIMILYNIKGIIFPVLFILMISISYSVLKILFMSIWLLYVSSFLKTQVIHIYKINELLKNYS